MTTHKPNNNFSKFLGRSSLAIFAAAAFVLPACSMPVAEVDSAEDARENVTSEEISDNFSAYVGQEVTIRQDIEETVGNYAFLLDEDQLFGGEEILVINTSNSPLELVDSDDTDVQVTGEVREFVFADLEREFTLGLEPDLFVDYEGRPVILARSIALSPDPGEVTDDPEQYYYRRIAIEGEISSIESSDRLTLEDETLFGGEGLLVISPQGAVVGQVGEDVAITGTLRPYVTAEFERDYDLTWDLDLQQQIEAEYENRPVFVADEIYPSAM